jgi:hypothetical protein
MKLIVITTMAFALTAAAQTPAGWQVMKDKKQLCQISVPAGWIADKIMPGSLTAGDKKASLIFSSKPDGVSYGEIARAAKDMFKPTQTFEETVSRTWFVSTPDRGSKGTTWYSAINSKPVCEVEIKFQDPTFEANAKLIVNSLKSTK